RRRCLDELFPSEAECIAVRPVLDPASCTPRGSPCRNGQDRWMASRQDCHRNGTANWGFPNRLGQCRTQDLAVGGICTIVPEGFEASRIETCDDLCRRTRNRVGPGGACSASRRSRKAAGSLRSVRDDCSAKLGAGQRHRWHPELDSTCCTNVKWQYHSQRR